MYRGERDNQVVGDIDEVGDMRPGGPPEAHLCRVDVFAPRLHALPGVFTGPHCCQYQGTNKRSVRGLSTLPQLCPPAARAPASAARIPDE